MATEDYLTEEAQLELNGIAKEVVSSMPEEQQQAFLDAVSILVKMSSKQVAAMALALKFLPVGEEDDT